METSSSKFLFLFFLFFCLFFFFLFSSDCRKSRNVDCDILSSSFRFLPTFFDFDLEVSGLVCSSKCLASLLPICIPIWDTPVCSLICEVKIISKNDQELGIIITHFKVPTPIGADIRSARTISIDNDSISTDVAYKSCASKHIAS